MMLLKFTTVIFTLLLIQCSFAQSYPYTRATNTGITRVTQIRSIGSYLYGNCFSSAFPTMVSMCRTSRAEGFVFNITLSELLNSYDGYGANVGTNDESLVFVGASRRFQEGFGASVLRGEIGNRISTVSPVDQFIGTVVASHYEYTNQSDNKIHYHLVFAQNRTWALHQFTVSDTETRSTSWPVETIAIPALASCFSAANPGDIIIRAAPYIQPQRLHVWIRNAGPTCSNLFGFSLAFNRFMFSDRSSVAAVSQAGPNTYWVGARQFCRMFLDGQVARILSCRSAPPIGDVQAIAWHEPTHNLYVASPGRISTANAFIPIEDMVVDSMVTLDDELLWTATDTSGNSFTYLAKYSSFRATWDAPSVQGPIATGSNVDLFPAMLGFLIAFIVCGVLMVIGWTLFIVLKVRLSRTKFERVELSERLMN